MADNAVVEQALVLGSKNTLQTEFETKDKSLSCKKWQKYKLEFNLLVHWCVFRLLGSSVETTVGSWLRNCINCRRFTNGYIVDNWPRSHFNDWWPSKVFQSRVRDFRTVGVKVYVITDFSFSVSPSIRCMQTLWLFSVSQLLLVVFIVTIDIHFVPVE